MEGAQDFGRYLQSVAERDIDLLLMEEFHVDESFAAWFAQKAGLGEDAVFDGAWHSLNDDAGETDLLLRVRFGQERIAIMIENKIGAPEQHEQDLRYHIRGRRVVAAGHCDHFITAICAPQAYLEGLPEGSAYERHIAYEDVRDWYGRQSGARAAWRRAIMAEAIDQGRRGYVMKVHAGKTAFHFAYWELIQERYPMLVMARPGPKGPKSDWIRFKGHDFPSGVTLNHKNDQGCMDVEFARTKVADLLTRRNAKWPEGVRILQRGGAAALSLPVPRIDMAAPLASQIDRVTGALDAAMKLAPLARVLQSPSAGSEASTQPALATS